MAESSGAKVSMSAQVVVQGLCVSYGEHRILHAIDLMLAKGEFVSIVGKSGSGKSTLLYALAGFIKKEGTIQIPNHIGVVFQNYAVFPWLTVEKNIALGLQKLNRLERKKQVQRHLRLIDLEEHAHKYPSQLSGGQSQRVALARALAPDPALLLMDEPFGALDPYTQDKMETWLLDIWEKNHKTVLFVTHNIEQAIFLSDRVMVLGEGKILQELEISFARPRAEEIKFSNEFLALKKHVLAEIEKTTNDHL